MEITQVQDITSQKGYKFNNQFFVAYEGNQDFNPNNVDYLTIQEWINNGGIVEPEYTQQQILERAKQTKTDEIKAIKDFKLYEPISYMNRTFYATVNASSNIIAKMVLGGDIINWLDYDNQNVQFTLEEFRGLAAAIENQRSIAYFTEAQRCKAINDATTIEEVEAVTW